MILFQGAFLWAVSSATLKHLGSYPVSRVHHWFSRVRHLLLRERLPQSGRRYLWRWVATTTGTAKNAPPGDHRTQWDRMAEDWGRRHLYNYTIKDISCCHSLQLKQMDVVLVQTIPSTSEFLWKMQKFQKFTPVRSQGTSPFPSRSRSPVPPSQWAKATVGRRVGHRWGESKKDSKGLKLKKDS